MPYRRRYSAKMPDYDMEVTVVDVYDMASDIGKECEIIIEKYGPEAVTALLPKVINALELLENLAVRNEKENQALNELTAKISQLENDKIEKAEYRQRFEKEIEAIEEQWRTESAELVTAVARLQDENKRLRRTINSPADGEFWKWTSAPPSPAREHDQEVLSRLSSTAEKQRATLRHQELQLQEKQQLIDSLTNQVEKLAQVSRDLRRKHKQLQNQMRLVCEERTELTAIVQSQQRDITALQKSDAKNKCTSCSVAMEDDEDQSSKPTFSVRELRAILHERNELKLKLNRAEEQLQALQAEPQPDSSGSDTSPSISTTAVDDEAPVQGPLPAEPDDAPWKRNSGIRKFFRKLFAESDIAVGGFSRRQLGRSGAAAAATAPA
ncbi:RILP-like protein homolog isoform X2 [Danaus plexippus]|uniref:RILP-like protein homolog isoform X2 n=1 Tax=Danaus plexippus TaxID=13037 RepID=UPI002AB2A147|nr:RILP-like protein homolog isoform X2 [Danaus plexippus]